MKNKLFALLITLLFLCFIFMGAAKVIDKVYNVQISGWMFGKDAQFAGERTWAKASTLDTLVITGVDTTCAVFLQAKTDTICHLKYDIRSAGDTVFVTSDSTGTTTDKYSYLVIRNAYGASD